MARIKKRATQATLARILGISPSGISNAKHDPTFPQPDASNEYEIKAVILWWHTNRDGGCHDDAALFENTDSPHLERLRSIKADREELRLAVERGQLMDVDEFRRGYVAALMPIRNCAESFRRQGNTKAFDMLQNACLEVADGLDAQTNASDSTT